MKKILLMTYRLMALTLLLFVYNANVIALQSKEDFDISIIDKIPVTSAVPSFAEILKPVPGFYLLTCNKTFPEPELFFNEKTEVTIGGVEYIRYFLSINNKEDYPDYLFTASPGLPALASYQKPLSTKLTDCLPQGQDILTKFWMPLLVKV